MTRRVLVAVLVSAVLGLAGCSTAATDATSRTTGEGSAPGLVTSAQSTDSPTPTPQAAGPASTSTPASTPIARGTTSAGSAAGPAGSSSTSGDGTGSSTSAGGESVSVVDLHSVNWKGIALPVSALRPALAPTSTADGSIATLCTDGHLDWQTAEPTGWVTFAAGTALIPDPEGTPSSFDPHPGWAMSLGEPVFGQLGDGTAIAAMELICGPTGANGQNTMILVFDGAGSTNGTPRLIGIYQPPGQLKTNGLSIAGGAIAVTWGILEPADPRSSPSGTGHGTIGLVGGRLVPDWPDSGGLRAALWSIAVGSTGATQPPGSSSAAAPSGSRIDLTTVNWKSFSLPLEPLIAAATADSCLHDPAPWRKDFPDGLVPFRYEPPITGVTTTAAVEAFIPDPSVRVVPGLPGKAGYLLRLSDPVFGVLTGGPAVAAFGMVCRIAVPADGAPNALLVLDGQGGKPNPLGIFAGGQYVSQIAVSGGIITAHVGDNKPWQGVLSVNYRNGALVPSLQPTNPRWAPLTLWGRPAS